MKLKRMEKIFLLSLAAVAFTLAASAQSANDESEKRSGDIWTLGTCPVSGEKLGSMGEPVVKVYDGREVRFCCAGCVPRFEADPDSYLSKADASITENQKGNYPLTTCIVSGEKLSPNLTDNHTEVIGNRLFAFCCPACPAEVKKNPEKYIEKLNQAVTEKQVKDYPAEVCPVSGQKLGSMGEPVNYVHGNQLVRFCCKGCVREFEKNPEKYMEKVSET
jgi:YHS domain-containing protein